MFLYKGSKLENDIEKLTKEVSTPEYEKDHIKKKLKL